MSTKPAAAQNSKDKHERCSLPELRIIDQELWDAVKARQASTTVAMDRDGDGNALNRAHRRRFVLSGLLKCGMCGGGYTVMAKDRYGCAAHTKSGTCVNGSTIARASVERRVLGALQDRIMTPELLAAFIEGYNAELADSRSEARQRTAATRSELATVQRKLANVVDAIERMGLSASLATSLSALETRQATLMADAAMAAGEDTVMPLPPPATAEMYRDKLATLVEALSNAEMQTEAGTVVRSLIGRVVMVPTPDAPDRHWLELHGDLAVALALATGGVLPGLAGIGRVPVRQVSVVAGTGFEPVTFRL